MSVEVLSPSLAGPSGHSGDVVGTNGFVNEIDHDVPMANGTSESSQKFPAGMILPPPDMRSEGLLRSEACLRTLNILVLV
jgi:hypothetical protein